MNSSQEADHTDPFDEVLNLEESYYNEGYTLGLSDGRLAGRSEGRIFGLEKGFEKFAQMGRLNGRAAVWSGRLDMETTNSDAELRRLKSLGGSERLRKHIHRLQQLTDPETLNTENSEDAVSDFDDRLKDGEAKATLIARIVGEDKGLGSTEPGEPLQPLTARSKALRAKRDESAKQTGEMEDFTGLPGGKKLVKD